jgi:hypothetical protein
MSPIDVAEQVGGDVMTASYNEGLDCQSDLVGLRIYAAIYLALFKYGQFVAEYYAEQYSVNDEPYFTDAHEGDSAFGPLS